MSIFDLKPWEKYRDKKMADLKCPHCDSQSVHFSTELSKAIIDKKDYKELVKITEVENCG
jgi:hypothetical protein